MPANNYMYSVLSDTDLPEENGYRYHSPVPEQPADVDLDQVDIEAIFEIYEQIIA